VILIVVNATIEKPSHPANLMKKGKAESASQVYGLGLIIYELTLQSLNTIEQKCMHNTNIKMLKAYIKRLSAVRQELVNKYNLTLNNEIALFYQSKGLYLNEVGQIHEYELEEIIYPILDSYACKLYQLEEILNLMDINNQNEVLMLGLELIDNLYSVFRQLSHLYPIVELRPLFKEMAENASKVYLSLANL
jgi:hypothetical protein